MAANEDGLLKLEISSSEGPPIVSDRILLQNLPWRLMVVSQDAIRSSQGGKGKTMGVFVQCVPDSPGSCDWSVVAHVEVKVKNFNNPDKSYVKAFEHKYSNSSSDWGYSSFMKWKDLSDSSKGFIKEGKICIEAKVRVEKTIESKAAQGGTSRLSLGGMTSNMLECPSCGKEFESKGERQPMSLLCGHTFCSACLQKMSTKSEDRGLTLKCSSCSQLHISKSGNVTELWFPNHSMVQIIENMLSKSKYFCQTHQHDKNYYCFDDHILVCIYCAYHGSHSTHACKHLDEAKLEAEAVLKRVKLSVSSSIAQVERRLQFARSERELLRTQGTSAREMIGEHYEKIKAALLKQKELLLQELENCTAEVATDMDSTLQKLEEKDAEVRAVFHEYSLWQTLPALEALEKFSEVQSSLSSVASMSSGAAKASLKESSPQPSCPALSFETSPLSEVAPFGQLGRIVMVQRRGQDKGGAERKDGGDDAVTERSEGIGGEETMSVDTFPGPELPPNKKRKKSLSTFK